MLIMQYQFIIIVVNSFWGSNLFIPYHFFPIFSSQFSTENEEIPEDLIMVWSFMFIHLSTRFTNAKNFIATSLLLKLMFYSLYFSFQQLHIWKLANLLLKIIMPSYALDLSSGLKDWPLRPLIWKTRWRACNFILSLFTVILCKLKLFFFYGMTIYFLIPKVTWDKLKYLQICLFLYLLLPYFFQVRGSHIGTHLPTSGVWNHTQRFLKKGSTNEKIVQHLDFDAPTREHAQPLPDDKVWSFKRTKIWFNKQCLLKLYIYVLFGSCIKFTFISKQKQDESLLEDVWILLRAGRLEEACNLCRAAGQVCISVLCIVDYFVFLW